MARGWISRQLAAGRFAALTRPVVLIVLVGTFLAILGPFGSDSIPWPQIWLYWVGFIALGGVFGYGAGEIAPRLFPRLPQLGVYAIIPFFVAIPVTLAILWLEGVLSRELTLGRLAATYSPALVISAFVSAVSYAADRIFERGGSMAEAGGPGRALTDKLPHRLRSAAIHALTAEDHYLRVRTDRGEALILIRLTDAIAALEGVDRAPPTAPGGWRATRSPMRKKATGAAC